MTRARDMANIAAGSFSIPSGSLSNAVPADGSITTAKLAANAVTNAKLASGAITSTDLPSGTVLQVKQASTSSEVTKNDTSWVDTGLFTGVTFDNALQSSSKVFCTIEVSVSEAQAGAWAVPICLTLYEGSTNIGDSTFGIVAGHGVDEYASGAQYTLERLYGSLLYTPASTNPSYKLYMRSNNSTGFNRTLGSANNTDARYNVGGTRITLMEIAG